MDNLGYLCIPIILIIVTLHIIIIGVGRLRNLPPSPFPALPVVGHLYLLRKLPFHKSLYDVANKYGSVLYLRFGWRPVLLVSSPSAAEECFTKNDVIFANRPTLLTGKYLGYNYTSLPFSSYGERWRNLRRISTVELLSSHRIQKLAKIRAEEVKELVFSLFRLSNNPPPIASTTSDDHHQVVELKPCLHDFTFNAISRMIFGKKYYGEKVENYEAAKLFQEISKDQIRVIPKTNVLDFLPFMRWFGFGDIEDQMKTIFEKRDKFMQNVIDEHRRDQMMMMMVNGSDDSLLGTPKLTTKTVLDVLLDLQAKEPDFYTDQTIRDLLLVLLQAASDTSSVTLEWAFSYMLENPEVLRKAQADIDKHVGHDKRLVEESDLPALPYIRCIVNETLRMHPAAPLLVPHFSSQECTVAGFRIPRGTILVVNVWAIHHDPKVWEDPGVFNPERFQGFQDTSNNGCKFMPFGSGRRKCPGENLAFRVLELALASLLQCFDWERDIMDGGDENSNNNEGTGGFTISAMTHPLRVKCHPRPITHHLLSNPI